MTGLVTREPNKKEGVLVKDGFVYTSDNNSDWMAVEELREWIEANKEHIGIL